MFKVALAESRFVLRNGRLAYNAYSMVQYEGSHALKGARISELSN